MKNTIVIKIGSSVICQDSGRLDNLAFNNLVSQISQLHRKGEKLIMVVSGAVACGKEAVNKIGNSYAYHCDNPKTNLCFSTHLSEGEMRKKEKTVLMENDGKVNIELGEIYRQASAGIGQVMVIDALYKEFLKNRIMIAQILLTKDFLRSKSSKLRLSQILNLYMINKIIPVINENDVMDLNSFGGNDFLGSEIAKLINSRLFLIVSTPRGSVNGVGGGKTKLEVQKLLTQENIKTAIVDGRINNIILESI